MSQKQDFTKYERARILGARSLQISMDAPLLIKVDKNELEGLNYDPLKIAEKELDAGVLPITVNRPLPGKAKDKGVEKLKIEDNTVSDEKKIEAEQEAEKEILESGDLMELSGSEEERAEKTSSDAEE